MSQNKINQPIVHMVSDEEAQGKTQEIFQHMKETAGEVPKWMRVMANCEDTLVGFMALFKSLMDNEPVNALLKWKVAYVVSELNKCELCVDITKMKMKSMGIQEEDIAKLEDVSDEKEKIALEYAKEVTQEAFKISNELLEKMKENFSDKEIVEITAVVGLFNFTNRFNDALKIYPDIK